LFSVSAAHVSHSCQAAERKANNQLLARQEEARLEALRNTVIPKTPKQAGKSTKE
jgi:hypothetical protein